MRVARARRPDNLSRPEREDPLDCLDDKITAMAISQVMMERVMMKQKTTDHSYELQGSPGSLTFSTLALTAIVLIICFTMKEVQM